MTTSTTQLVRCPSCGKTNRVRASTEGEGSPICGNCKTPLDSPARPITVTDENFQREIVQSPLPVLLDMWAPWCGPCRMIAPVIEALASELSGRVRVAKLNTDENPQTSARFKVQSIPLLLIFKDGVEVDRLVGAYPKEEILRRLQALV